MKSRILNSMQGFSSLIQCHKLLWWFFSLNYLSKLFIHLVHWNIIITIMVFRYWMWRHVFEPWSSEVQTWQNLVHIAVECPHIEILSIRMVKLNHSIILKMMGVWLSLLNGKKWEVVKCFKCFQPRTTDTQRELFFKNLKLLGLGRQIGPKFYEAFWVFLAKL